MLSSVNYLIRASTSDVNPAATIERRLQALEQWRIEVKLTKP
jgi:hypothetical protein